MATTVSTRPKGFARLRGLLGALVCCVPCLGLAQAYFDGYGLSPGSAAVDIGVQPLGYPSGVISSVMQRDRLLKRALAQIQLPLRTHPFKRGADMVALLGDQRLEAGLLGDLPTLLAASTGSVWIVGLVKQSPTAIVASGDAQVADLKGQRIAYVEASSAHLTLLQGLASAGIAESQVKLLPMAVNDMPDALARGEVAAFAAWEPAPSVALANSEKNHIVFRGQTTDYFVIEQSFATRFPLAARQVVASFVRAIGWMRRSQSNVETAARWATADTQAFAGKPGTLSIRQIAGITRREILDIPSAPALLAHAGAPMLKHAYDFLHQLGKLPAGAQWSRVEQAFAYDGVGQVLSDASGYQLNTFDYEP